MHGLLREDMRKLTFIFLNCLHCSWSAHNWEKAPLCERNISPYVLHVPSCVIQTDIKDPIFWSYPLLKELNGQPLTAVDQISSASSEKNVGPSLFELAIRSDGSDEGPALGVCLCMQEASLLPKLSLSAVHRSVFLTCVVPLQNKQRWGKTAPNSLSTPSFPQSLHENRWLWHYQQSQLVSHACSGGGRISWPLPFLQSQWWKGPLFITVCLVLFRGIIDIFHRSVIQEKHAFSLLQVVFISKF